MTKQAKNFEALCEGANVSSIKMALQDVASSVCSELMAKYDADTIDELATKMALR